MTIYNGRHFPYIAAIILRRTPLGARHVVSFVVRFHQFVVIVHCMQYSYSVYVTLWNIESPCMLSSCHFSMDISSKNTRRPQSHAQNWINWFHTSNVILMKLIILSTNSSQVVPYRIHASCENSSWWRHQMETFSALLAICAGNSPVPGEVPAQRPVTRSFGVFLDLRLNKRWSKQSWGWWFETLSCPFWRHCNVEIISIKWKYFPRYWPFVRGIHRSPVDFPHKGLWRESWMFSLIYAWTNGCAKTHDASDLRRRRAHYDATVMKLYQAGMR